MHREFLLKTLELALRRRGFCAPNPSVGAIVVKNNQIVSESVHHCAGENHAEVNALRQLSYPIGEAVLYVSLEPCGHHGRTPPCVDEIIASGITEVVFAYRDPNPLVIESHTPHKLAQAGIRCTQVDVAEIEAFYQSYHHWMCCQKPFVTAKIAQTLDGAIALADGTPVAITGQEAKEFTHTMRLRSDILLTTAATILNDDPQLNVRLGEEAIAKPIAILDNDLSITKQANIFQTSTKQYIFYDKAHGANKTDTTDCQYIPVDCQEGHLDIAQVLTILGEIGFHDVWVEAGGQLTSHLLSHQLLNRLYCYIAPKILAAPKKKAFYFNDAYSLPSNASCRWFSLGQDGVLEILFSGE